MKKIQGVVSSIAMDKTAVITVDTYKRHPIYKKRYKTTKKFFAHDENNSCQIGDLITIQEHRPISKKKKWIVV